MTGNDYIILYHGATTTVSEPLAHVGRPDLDFGPGFYLTNDRQQAVSWARTKASRKQGQCAFLNIYRFDFDGFSLDGKYRRKIFREYNVEWLDFIAYSRKGRKPWKGIDWIEGGIANDRVITTVDAYVDGLITAGQAMDRLVNERLRHQVCISNQEIIDRFLTFAETIKI